MPRIPHVDDDPHSEKKEAYFPTSWDPKKILRHSDLKEEESLGAVKYPLKEYSQQHTGGMKNPKK